MSCHPWFQESIREEFELLWLVARDNSDIDSFLNKSFEEIVSEVALWTHDRLRDCLTNIMKRYLSGISDYSTITDWTQEELAWKNRMREKLVMFAKMIDSWYERLLESGTHDLFEDMYLLTKKETIAKYKDYFS